MQLWDAVGWITLSCTCAIKELGLGRLNAAESRPQSTCSFVYYTCRSHVYRLRIPFNNNSWCLKFWFQRWMFYAEYGWLICFITSSAGAKLCWVVLWDVRFSVSNYKMDNYVPQSLCYCTRVWPLHSVHYEPCRPEYLYRNRQVYYIVVQCTLVCHQALVTISDYSSVRFTPELRH